MNFTTRSSARPLRDLQAMNDFLPVIVGLETNFGKAKMRENSDLGLFQFSRGYLERLSVKEPALMDAIRKSMIQMLQDNPVADEWSFEGLLAIAHVMESRGSIIVARDVKTRAKAYVDHYWRPSSKTAKTYADIENRITKMQKDMDGASNLVVDDPVSVEPSGILDETSISEISAWANKALARLVAQKQETSSLGQSANKEKPKEKPTRKENLEKALAVDASVSSKEPPSKKDPVMPSRANLDEKAAGASLSLITLPSADVWKRIIYIFFGSEVLAEYEKCGQDPTTMDRMWKGLAQLRRKDAGTIAMLIYLVDKQAGSALYCAYDAVKAKGALEGKGFINENTTEGEEDGDTD